MTSRVYINSASSGFELDPASFVELGHHDLPLATIGCRRPECPHATNKRKYHLARMCMVSLDSIGLCDLDRWRPPDISARTATSISFEPCFALLDQSGRCYPLIEAPKLRGAPARPFSVSSQAVQIALLSRKEISRSEVPDRVVKAVSVVSRYIRYLGSLFCQDGLPLGCPSPPTGS